jgi:ubiquinone/menaquinone biosynthesis C-methylase UbiE
MADTRWLTRWWPLTASRTGMRVLDVGSGKGFYCTIYARACRGWRSRGLIFRRMVSNQHTTEDVEALLPGRFRRETALPRQHFDLVISITTLHNLYNYDLHAAFKEIERVSRGAKYIASRAIATSGRKVNPMYWQLTCRAFHTPEEWDFIFKQSGYTVITSSFFRIANGRVSTNASSGCPCYL